MAWEAGLSESEKRAQVRGRLGLRAPDGLVKMIPEYVFTRWRYRCSSVCSLTMHWDAACITNHWWQSCGMIHEMDGRRDYRMPGNLGEGWGGDACCCHKVSLKLLGSGRKWVLIQRMMCEGAEHLLATVRKPCESRIAEHWNIKGIIQIFKCLWTKYILPVTESSLLMASQSKALTKWSTLI